MKRLLCLCLMLMVLLSFSLTQAEGTKLTAYGVEFDADATVIDLDEPGIKVTKDIEELKALLNAMPNLTEVRMYNSKLKKAQMDELFDGYPQIFFGWTFEIGPHVIRTDQTAFSTLHGHSGKKGDPFHTSKQFEMFRYCKYMLALDIGHNSTTSLEFLRQMPQLKVLILGANYSCEGLDAIADLKDLEYLEVFSTNCRDATPLAGLTKLRDLNLACNYKLRDISCLYDLPSLERFWGMGIGIKEDKQKEMEAAHPNVEFDWVNYPSEGTWRKHPHYDTIYKIFHEMKYYPFDD